MTCLCNHRKNKIPSKVFIIRQTGNKTGILSAIDKNV